MKKMLAVFAVLTALSVALIGCGGEKKEPAAAKPAEQKEISVGVTAGPQAEIMEVVKTEAEKKGLKIKLVEFSDFIQPNVALANKELDMNSYQHKPFLDSMNSERGLKLTDIGKTVLMPMAIYSQKYKKLEDVPAGSTVTIPNDPTNGGRALLLLQDKKLLKLKDNVGIRATVADITENPKNFKIVELEAAQVPRSLADTDLACVNTNYALNVGLNPLTDSLAVESSNSPYTCVMAVREADKDNASYKKVLEIYQSEPVKKFIEEKYKGSILPGF